MIRFFSVLVFLFAGLSCFQGKENNYPNEIIQFKSDSLVIYSSNPDSFSQIYSSDHFTHLWWGDLKPASDSLLSEIKNCEIIIRNLSIKLDWKIPDKKIIVNWYPSLELKTMKSGDSEFDSYKENETYHVWNSDLPRPSFAKEIDLIFKEQTDKIKNKKLKNAFLESLSETNKQYLFQTGFFSLDSFPGLSEIINPQSGWANEKILSHSALSDFFSVYHNKSAFYQILITISEDGQNVSDEMKNLWVSRKFNSEKIKAIESKNISIKGFNFTHEGYRIYNGYLSESAKKSLMKLKEIHSDAISLIPFGFMSSESEPNLFWANQSGSENDESIIYAGINAKKIGFQVMLKPQLWLRRGVWCGEIEMKNDADWKKFENEYRIWILHYAAIAQHYNFEFLSLGVELLKFTKQRPEFFTSLISDIRKIYDGQLTYSANWYDEADHIQFWDKLDFIGINSYYPLSEKENAGETELENSAEKLTLHFSDLSEKWNRKIVFTEIGFAKNRYPWIMPHDERNNQDFSETQQALCYKLVSDEWLNRTWCGGFLWWKWSSSLEIMNEDRINFFPGLSAKRVVAESFAK